MFNNPNEPQKEFNAIIHSALQLMQLAPIIMQAELSDAQHAAIKERMLPQKDHIMVIEASPHQVALLYLSMLLTAASLGMDERLVRLNIKKINDWLMPDPAAFSSMLALLFSSLEDVTGKVFDPCPCYACIQREIP